MMPRGSGPVCIECGWREGTPPESDIELPPRTILNDVYMVGRKLGRGGFGVTYLAWDTTKDDRRAIKEYLPSSLATRVRGGRTVKPSSNQSREPFVYGLRKFIREAEILKRFAGHPNIAGVRELFQGNGTAYIVMNYFEGITLKEYLDDKKGKIPFETALKILIPVMDALREVHEAGTLHRDISPDNIYLCYSGPVKLLDFGAAKQAIGEQSQSIQAIFKPGYTPQEQYLTGGKQGPWTDVYALGATLYRSITGQMPPLAWDRLEKDEIKQPGQLGIRIPRQSEAALMRALAVRPEQRYRSVTQFQSALLQKDSAVGPVPRPSPQPEPGTVRTSKALFLSLYAAVWGLFDVLAIASQIRHLWAAPLTGDTWLDPLLVTSSILGFIVLLTLVHRMWQSIQDSHTRRSPGEAVGMMFLPVYGVFQAVWGFSKEYNAYLSRRALRVSQLPEGLFLAYAVLSCALWIPVIGIPCIVAHYLLGTVMVSYICDAVNAVAATVTKRDTKRLQLYCVSGEFEGHSIEVPAEGLIIGRSGKRANLVLRSNAISSAHVRVWLDAAGSGIWVEDLNSTNGTRYFEPSPGDGHSKWKKMDARKLLTKGNKFQLADEIAEFEVREA